MSTNLNNLSDEDLMKLVRENSKMEDTTMSTVENTEPMEMENTGIYSGPYVSRNILVIGCGDGGCHIASKIHTVVKDSLVIAYNTSLRGMDTIRANIKIIPAEEDGTGKARAYSQNVFRKGSYKNLLEAVNKLAAKMDKLDYIIVCSTVDGGTGGGVSPMVAKYVSDNVETPVVIVGVYPSVAEDAIAQYNALSWQADVEKSGLPYMIFDNDGFTSKVEAHSTVNNDIATAMNVLAGAPFGDTDIAMIDNRDVYMLVEHLGNRITIISDTRKPSLGQSLDDYLIDHIERAHQPNPENVKGLGLFVKGPADLIKSVDTTLTKVRSIYGDAALMYHHLEESDEVCIALICAGSTEPSVRLAMMRQRYDDIKANERRTVSSVENILMDMTDPLGTPKKKTKGDNIDLGALGL